MSETAVNPTIRPPLPVTASLDGEAYQSTGRRRVLVIGARGFIGSEIVRVLKVHGFFVTCASIRAAGIVQATPGHFDAVIHAGWGGVERKSRNNLTIQQGNVKVLDTVLTLVEKLKPRHFITFGSQAEIYSPNTEYATAKHRCRDRVRAFQRDSDTICIWLRLFSVYGPGEGPEWLIPQMIRSLFSGGTLLLTPGHQLLDYTHVTDIARAVMLALTIDQDGEWDVATGKAVELRTVVELLTKITGGNVEVRFGAIPYPPDQVMNPVALPGRFMEATGWSPLIELKHGLKQVVEHIKLNG